MKIKILFVVTLFVTITTFTNCKHRGCTSILSCNYDEDAEKDDGSCIYKGKATFWHKTGSGYGVIIVLVEGIAGEGYLMSPVPSTPLCGAAGCQTNNLCPGTYNYNASEESPGTKTWNGSFTVTENGCLTIQLQ